MFRYSAYTRAIALTFALALFASCSDDDDPAGGGPVDSTAPSVTSVTALDANHVEVVFNENMQRGSAELVGNYVIIEAIPLATSGEIPPGDTLVVDGAALQSDQRTVTLSTQPMLSTSYDMSVAGVKDVAGNTIGAGAATSFTGSNAADVTAPELVYRSPGPNASNVAVGTQIVLTFSERITESFLDGFSISDGGADLPYELETEDTGIHIVLHLLSPLELGTQYTIALTGIEDESANVMTDVSWTFTTTNTADTTPPTLVSSSPANGSLNVDVNSPLSLTFSEAVDQFDLGISSYPEFGEGDIVWSNSGKTLTFTPLLPLANDQQYTVSAVPGGFQDLSGNGNSSYVQIRFSTGAALATGSFTGDVAGDPNSDFAQNSAGTRVFAVVGQLELFNDLQVAGSTTVAGSYDYDLRNLADGEFYALGIKNTNNDGLLDPVHGDAFGAFGVDFSVFDTEADTVAIVGGNRVTGVNFPLFDPSAVGGTIAYDGAFAGGAHIIGIGLFDASTFDPNNPVPDYATETFWPDATEWVLINFEHGFPDDTYYVGAYLDGNDNDEFDFGIDPIGIFGDIASPTAINIQDGSDRTNIVITLEDPVTRSTSASVRWHAPPQRVLPAWVRAVSTVIAKDTKTKQW